MPKSCIGQHKHFQTFNLSYVSQDWVKSKEYSGSNSNLSYDLSIKYSLMMLARSGYNIKEYSIMCLG